MQETSNPDEQARRTIWHQHLAEETAPAVHLQYQPFYSSDAVTPVISQHSRGRMLQVANDKSMVPLFTIRGIAQRWTEDTTAEMMI